ncbi:MAG: hypothetical protein ACJAZO_001871 [Myxococcota bacterium]|jgi:hypothetical protein
MHTGDTVTDSLGRTWQVGQPLGRGLWGGSWVLRGDNDAERVVKVAHARTDFASDARLPDGLERACAQCADEQANLLKRASHPFLPRLEDRVLITGRPALILPRYHSTLARRLGDGDSLGDIATLLASVAENVELLAANTEVHGNLRPSNILIKEDGQPVLSDMLTPTAAQWHQRLAALSPARANTLPPEAADIPGTPWDTWAVCACLYSAATWQPSVGDLRRTDEFTVPTGGLDKVELASLRDRALKRLMAEGANSRFVNRVCERLASLLNRGLSRPMEPSPPYRFNRAEDLRTRISEVAALIHPRVEAVGKILLPGSSPDGIYLHTEPVSFTVTVAVTEGVGSHEHIAVGLRLVDLDSPDRRRVRVQDASFDVKPHPSGRLRFHFSLRDIPPGRYDLEAAFSILDSGNTPIPARAEVNVRPPPGYVPPLNEAAHTPEPLSIPAPDDSFHDDPVRRDAARFPSPISPTASMDLDATSPTAVPSTGIKAPPSLPLPKAPTQLPASSPDTPALSKPTVGISPNAPTLQTAPRRAPLAEPYSMPAGQRSATATVAAPPTVPGQFADSSSPQTPAYDGPGQWEALPDPSTPEYVPEPDHVEDLPSWSPEDVEGASALSRLITVVRNDTFVQIMLGVVVIGVLTLGLVSLLKSCS